MQYFTADMFVDALILLLHNRTDHTLQMVSALLEIYEAETKNSTYIENETFSFYVFLLHEIISRKITINDTAEIEAFLLKFKANSFVTSDPELYTALRTIFTDKNEISDDRYQYITKRITNCILLYKNAKLIKKMFGKMANANSTNLTRQEDTLHDISCLCDEIIRNNQNTGDVDDDNDHQARKVDFDDKATLQKALNIYKETTVTNVFKTGWQALNRAFGPKGGFTLGESIVFNSLPHVGKSLMMLNFARWAVTLNTVSSTFKNPTCLFYSLENETPQNLMQLFRQLYCNIHHAVPPKDMTNEEIIEFCHEAFRINGWKLVIDRRLGSEFGYPELVANFEEYVAAGYTPLLCIIDYMNIMKKGSGIKDKTEGNWLQLRELYSNTVNFLKSKNCCLITGHQLNRRAAEVVQQNPIGAVKKFNISMLADGMDPQREIDCAFYMHKEYNQHGDAYLTIKIDKHRYTDGIPEKDAVFAYRFAENVGILDDINGPDMSVHNIYADKYHGDASEDTSAITCASSSTFGD